MIGAIFHRVAHMSALQRFVLSPSRGVRDIYVGIGSFLLILAVIAFAGVSFSFDAERKALLRPVGIGLTVLGAVLWLRGSFAGKSPPPADQ